MKFWDASAIVPLVQAGEQTQSLYSLLEPDPDILVWWGTPVEIVSALARRERTGSLSASEITALDGRMQQLAQAWQEILPSDSLRSIAQRLLRVHPLRAADSLQLAAAVTASGHQPSSLEFVCLDSRLSEAAQREGFSVLSCGTPPKGRGSPTVAAPKRS